MIISLRSFPIRPQIHPDESLIGYLNRFFEANGRPYKTWPSDLICGVRTLYRHRRHAIKRFAQAQACFAGMTELDPDLWIDRRIQRYRHLDGRKFLLCFQYSPRFCPMCLKQRGYWFLCWDLPFLRACPIHQCRLVEQCPNCKRKLEWREITDQKCACGMALTSMATQRASRALVELSRFLCHASGFPCPAHYRLPGYQGGFQEPSPMGAFLTILLLQNIHKQIYHQKPEKHLLPDNEIYEPRSQSVGSFVVPAIFADWPNNFIGWLDTALRHSYRNQTHVSLNLDDDVNHGLGFLNNQALKFSGYFMVKPPIIDEIEKFVARHYCAQSRKYLYPAPEHPRAES